MVVAHIRGAMMSFEQEVCGTYLNNHAPSRAKPKIGHVPAAAIAELFFEMAPELEGKRKRTPRTPAGVKALDKALMAMAESGDFMPLIRTSKRTSRLSQKSGRFPIGCPYLCF